MKFYVRKSLMLRFIKNLLIDFGQIRDLSAKPNLNYGGKISFLHPFICSNWSFYPCYTLAPKLLRSQLTFTAVFPKTKPMQTCFKIY